MRVSGSAGNSPSKPLRAPIIPVVVEGPLGNWVNCMKQHDANRQYSEEEQAVTAVLQSELNTFCRTDKMDIADWIEKKHPDLLELFRSQFTPQASDK